MKTKHTPGPWTYDDVWSLVTGPKGEEIAAVHAAQSNPKRCDKGIAQANAHLIAAAPELLEALSTMQSMMKQYGMVPDANDPFHPVWCRAESAILKATGGKE